MLKSIEGYWMSIFTKSFFSQQFTLDPLPPGTNVYASISLSTVYTLNVHPTSSPTPVFAADAWVVSWTFYKPDGTESAPQLRGQRLGAIAVENCATIKFAMFGYQVAATAHINIFTF